MNHNHPNWTRRKFLGTVAVAGTAWAFNPYTSWAAYDTHSLSLSRMHEKFASVRVSRNPIRRSRQKTN